GDKVARAVCRGAEDTKRPVEPLRGHAVSGDAGRRVTQGGKWPRHCSQRTELNVNRPPTIISLFSGAGGLDYGFEAAGFSTAAAVEMDRNCCETLRANRRWPVIERDLLQLSTAELLTVAKLGVAEADLLIGGPPCQPFSKSGY